jgi:hypothetical protein
MFIQIAPHYSLFVRANPDDYELLRRFPEKPPLDATLFVRAHWYSTIQDHLVGTPT